MGILCRVVARLVDRIMIGDERRLRLWRIVWLVFGLVGLEMHYLLDIPCLSLSWSEICDENTIEYAGGSFFMQLSSEIVLDLLARLRAEKWMIMWMRIMLFFEREGLFGDREQVGSFPE